MHIWKRSAVLLLAGLLLLALSACTELPADQPSAIPTPDAAATEGAPSTSPDVTPAPTAAPTDEAPADPGDPAQESPFGELRKGSTGPAVHEVKELLASLGLLSQEEVSQTPQLFNDATAAAVTEFQRRSGLEATGRVDSLTLAALRSADPADFSDPSGEETPAQSVEPPPATEPPDVTTEPQLPPLTGITIGIDPGHQAHGSSTQEPIAPGSSQTKPRVSSGTAGVASGVAEYIVNLQVGLKLRDLLEEYGATVVMTRETNGVDISNSERAQIMNEAGVDLAVRIHCDGEDDSSRHGAFVLVPVGRYTESIEAESRAAAESVLAAFVETTGAKDLGLSERDDQTGFNWSTVPVINIEMGHMSNREEDMKLVDDAYQDLCAEGIALGIVRHFAG